MGRIILIFLVLLLMGGAAAWTEIRPYAEPVLTWLSSSNVSFAKQSATVQSQTLSDRAAMLEITLSSTAARLELAERRLAAVEAQLMQTSILAAKPRDTAPQEVVTNEALPPVNPVVAVGEKSGEPQRSHGELGSKGSLLLLAVRQLREAVDRGTPFETELQTVRTLGGSRFNHALDPLLQLAQAGIPTRALLTERFKPNASAAIAAGSQSGNNWLEGRVSQLFSSVITVRRKDSSGDGSVEAIRRAEKLLADGDLIGCSEALNLVHGPAAAAIRPWMQAARTRINVDKTLSEILSLSIVTASENSE